MGASFRRVRWLGTWGNPGIRNGIILTIYVATGVQLEVSLMVVLSIFLGHELVTPALPKRCRKQLNRTNFIPLIPAKTVLDSFIPIWIDWKRHRHIRLWFPIAGIIHAA